MIEFQYYYKPYLVKLIIISFKIIENSILGKKIPSIFTTEIKNSTTLNTGAQEDTLMDKVTN